MSSDESRSPTFDGAEAAERSSDTVVDVSGLPRERPRSVADQPVDAPEQPDEAAQVVP
jgi:hypothetical protein